MVRPCEFPGCDQSAQWTTHLKYKVGRSWKRLSYCGKHADEMTPMLVDGR